MSTLSELWNNPPAGPSVIGMAKAAWEAMKAPGKAYQQGMTPDEMIKAGNDFAMTVGAGGSLVPKPGNSLGIFGGKLAKTANLEKLAKAEKFEKLGLHPDQIWQQTGWGRGPDGKWRFEINDQGAGLKQGAKETIDIGSPFLGSVYEHPRLFEAYPDLDMVLGVKPEKGNAKGSFDGKTIGVKTDMGYYDADSTMLHELQHAVQALEGFAQGTSPDGAVPDIQTALAAKIMVAKRAGLDKTDPTLKKLRALSKALEKLDDFKLYRTTAGEVEARNVQGRRFFDAQTRRDMTPWATEDIPRGSQIPIMVRNR